MHADPYISPISSDLQPTYRELASLMGKESGLPPLSPAALAAISGTTASEVRVAAARVSQRLAGDLPWPRPPSLLSILP